MGQPGLAGEPGMKVRKTLSAISLSDWGDKWQLVFLQD